MWGFCRLVDSWLRLVGLKAVIIQAKSVSPWHKTGAARRLLESGGLYRNGEKLVSTEGSATIKLRTSDLVDGEVCLLRTGKKHYHLIRFE